MLQTFYAVVIQSCSFGTVKMLHQYRIQRVGNERRFSAARYTRNGDESAKRQMQIYVFEIMTACAPQYQGFAVAVSSFVG